MTYTRRRRTDTLELAVVVIAATAISALLIPRHHAVHTPASLSPPIGAPHPHLTTHPAGHAHLVRVGELGIVIAVAPPGAQAGAQAAR